MIIKPTVAPTGQAGFSVTREARGFKGSEENKSYSQELILDREIGLTFIDQLQNIANQLHAKEIERKKAAGKSVRYALPVINYKEMDDGRIRLTFKRREVDGPPPVVDAENKPFTSYIKREHQIQVAFTIKPYVMATVFGVSLQLLAVKVLGTETAKLDISDVFGGPTAPDPAKVDVNDLF